MTFVAGLALVGQTAAERAIPEALKVWEAWATWNDGHRNCPRSFNDAKKHLCLWPSRLDLQVDQTAGWFGLAVTTFNETWVPLPGGPGVWPVDVMANGAPAPVVEHEGAPAIRLAAGTHHLAGVFRWNELPHRIPLPRAIGLLALTLNGTPVDAPTWDTEGFLWLKRDSSAEETVKDFLGVKLHAVLEDGRPLWLRSEIELVVSGKNREEEIGTVLPQGWKLAAIESEIPVAIDASGGMKAQVRAGTWIIRADAFRLDNPGELRYAPEAKPAVVAELIAFRADPEFRTVEITGAPAIDVSQTTFPAAWRELPVFRWETASALRLEERLRGLGDQQPEGITIGRRLWLDENGGAFTFHDSITGRMQQIWRLDVAPSHHLGAVRSAGQGQLITRNPQNGATGVEVRARDLDVEATGRIDRAHGLLATGWSADADTVNVTLNLPPGWRLLALFGADRVDGDWLTAWTLLDLFLLFIFAFAVFRLWGGVAGVLAFFAFGLSFHEPGAPRYLWLALLVPIALLRVVPAGRLRRLVLVAKWATVTVFILLFVPFVARQIEQALYPQLEDHGPQRGPQFALFPTDSAIEFRSKSVMSGAGVKPNESLSRRADRQTNLLDDPKARIQTGPAIPAWEWRTVTFGWGGPVTASQKVHPVFISPFLQRLLTVVRVGLVLALAALLLDAARFQGSFFRFSRRTAALLVIALLSTSSISAQAQVPDEKTLDTLRGRLLQAPDAFPHAADIPFASLKLEERRITIEAEIHAAVTTAVPLPGRLPAWSPLSVLIDEKPEVALRRDDGYLWVVLPEGVHRVRLEGLLADVREWEWTFLLQPRRVTIDAPGWTIKGVRPDGSPEGQVFFVQAQKTAGAATYERQELEAAVQVERELELGLVWRVRTTVQRLAKSTKAVTLRIPLLAGESVLTSNTVVSDGLIEVNLGAEAGSFSWESGLPISDRLDLVTRADDGWVERWRLNASPVWNVALSGLPPTFDRARAELVPVWRPWPGEAVELAISRPEAVVGATTTVSKVAHEITLGKRQRASKLDLSLSCSLGHDFLVELAADAELTAVTHNGSAIPARNEGGRLVLPLRPGEQTFSAAWKSNTPLGIRATADTVQLPVGSANIQTTINVPDDRWILWTHGPRRGPAVRFWLILIGSLLAAVALGRLEWSPLRTVEWMLLVIGLTQVPLPAALTVVAWLFFLAWRGRESFGSVRGWEYNLLQWFLVALTAGALGILVTAVGEGLLGQPEMFIAGDNSSRSSLQWFQALSDPLLPQPGCITVSIWWYRFLMLAWALWLARALLRWLLIGWDHFTRGGIMRPWRQPSPVPATAASSTPPPPP